MSKSLGNFVTIRELLGRYSGAVVRFNMLKTHYRQPIDWRADQLRDEAEQKCTLLLRSLPTWRQLKWGVNFSP